MIHATMQCVQDGLSYFATAVSYMCKMAMKLTSDVKDVNFFPFHSATLVKNTRAFFLVKPFHPGLIVKKSCYPE